MTGGHQCVDLRFREGFVLFGSNFELNETRTGFLSLGNMMEKALVATVGQELLTVERNITCCSITLVKIVEGGDSSQNSVDGAFTPLGLMFLEQDDAWFWLAKPGHKLSQLAQTHLGPVQLDAGEILPVQFEVTSIGADRVGGTLQVF